MANSRYYSSIALPTTLTSPIGTSDVQIQVASTFGFPLTLPYTLALDYGASNEELVQVNNVGGLTLDITRAIDGTSVSSHNPGAVVRHVSSARDFTDSRTHEASGTAVHGLTGAVVGTTDSQVLSNKTLTSPIINGGSMSGTITGTPTFNSPITFSSTAVMNAGLNVNNNLVTVTRGSSGSLGYATQVTGDTISRWNILASGLMSWGAGGVSATDSTLERAGTSLLRATDTELRSTRVTSTNNAYTARVTTDINDRFRVRADGQIFLGDGTNAPDVNLFRDAANVLRTNDSLTVDGALTFGTTLQGQTYTAGAWSSWVPGWSTTSGLHIPTFGNATVVGRYAVFGKTMHFTLLITFGSTTNFNGGTTTDNWIFSMPVGLTINSTVVANPQIALANGRLTQSSANTCPMIARPFDANNFLIDTAGGKQDGNALTNSGTIDAVTPWTWGTGDIIQFAGSIELN